MIVAFESLVNKSPHSIARRSLARQEVSWFDLGIAAIVGIFLLIFPDWLWLLAYHL